MRKFGDDEESTVRPPGLSPYSQRRGRKHSSGRTAMPSGSLQIVQSSAERDNPCG